MDTSIATPPGTTTSMITDPVTSPPLHAAIERSSPEGARTPTSATPRDGVSDTARFPRRRHATLTHAGSTGSTSGYQEGSGGEGDEEQDSSGGGSPAETFKELSAAAVDDRGYHVSSVASSNPSATHGRQGGLLRRYPASSGPTLGNSFEDFYPMSPSELVRDGDILFLSCPRDTMVTFLGSNLSEFMPGLRVLGGTARALVERGTSFFEVVISHRNLCVGHCPCDRRHGDEGPPVAGAYGMRIVAARHVPFPEIGDGRAPIGGELCGEMTTPESRESDDSPTRRTGTKITNSPGHAPMMSPASAFSSTGMEENPNIAEHERERGQDGVGTERRQVSHRGGRGASLLSSPSITSSPFRARTTALPARTISATVSASGDALLAEDDGGWDEENRAGGGRSRRVATEVLHRRLASGDSVLVLASEEFYETWKDSQEFDLVTRTGSVPKPVKPYDYVALVVFCFMLAWVLLYGVVMVRDRNHFFPLEFGCGRVQVFY